MLKIRVLRSAAGVGSVASALLFASLATACGVSSSSSSCDVVPNGGQDTRIEVSGTNAGSACQTIASQLGGDWSLHDSSNRPSEDVRAMCSGTVSGASYTVWDHLLVNATGYGSCQTLGGTFTGESPSPT